MSNRRRRANVSLVLLVALAAMGVANGSGCSPASQVSDATQVAVASLARGNDAPCCERHPIYDLYAAPVRVPVRQ